MSYVNQLEGWFRYFAYGSNLSSLRIRLDNPSAEKIGIGKLMDHELYFGTIRNEEDNFWTGGCASIREKQGEEVWGVVWRIDLVDLPNLERQEGGYESKTVTIKMFYGESLTCCTYELPEYIPLPPMPAYKEVCIEGARENHLPEDYITKLLDFADNGDHETVSPVMLRMAEARKKLQDSIYQIDNITPGAIDSSEGYFHYFAYGSNINTKRLQINNPSARKVAVGKLKDFKLFFGLKEFPGHRKYVGASIEESKGDAVWGVIWRTDLSELSCLDRQERVHHNFYGPMEVTVVLEDGVSTTICRTYKMLKPFEPFSPSSLYKSVIVDGAEEHNLPEDYIKTLKAIPEGPSYTDGPEKDSYLRVKLNL